MKNPKGLIRICAAPAFMILASHHSTGSPYLDAGTGSIIIQGLIGGLGGGLFAVKIFWSRISIFTSEASANQIFMPIIFSILAAFLLWVLLSFLVKDKIKAGLAKR
jgi:hypothetical protein